MGLQALRHRSVHIMRRMFPIIEQMVSRTSSSSDMHTRPLQEMVSMEYGLFVVSC